MPTNPPKKDTGKRISNVNNPKKGTEETNSFLSRIYIELAYRIGLTNKGSDSIMLQDKLMNIYLRTIRQAYVEEHGEDIPSNKLNSVKGNLRRQLLNPTKTWKMFCTAMYFLRVTKIDFKITVHRRNTSEVIEIDRTLTLGKTARDVAANHEGYEDDDNNQ